MAISLDYMGKLVIVMIVVAVSVGIITQFRGQIDDNIDGLNNGEDEEGLEIIEVSDSNPEGKISDLITLCYERSLENGFEDFSCFLARKESGDFNINKNDIQNKLDNDVNQSTRFDHNTYGRDSIVIRFSVTPDKVVVEE